MSTHIDNKDSVLESFNHLSIFVSCLVWIIFSTPGHFVSNFFCVIFTLLKKGIYMFHVYSWWSHTFYVVYWLTGHKTPSYVLTYLLCCGLFKPVVAFCWQTLYHRVFQYLFSLTMNERFNADGGYIGQSPPLVMHSHLHSFCICCCLCLFVILWDTLIIMNRYLNKSIIMKRYLKKKNDNNEEILE